MYQLNIIKKKKERLQKKARKKSQNLFKEEIKNKQQNGRY